MSKAYVAKKAHDSDTLPYMGYLTINNEKKYLNTIYQDIVLLVEKKTLSIVTRRLVRKVNFNPQRGHSSMTRKLMVYLVNLRHDSVSQ